ncbi:hypothetical protein VTN02DRAFT_566 [Thermoascus thermophilus]
MAVWKSEEEAGRRAGLAACRASVLEPDRRSAAIRGVERWSATTPPGALDTLERFWVQINARRAVARQRGGAWQGPALCAAPSRPSCSLAAEQQLHPENARWPRCRARGLSGSWSPGTSRHSGPGTTPSSRCCCPVRTRHRISRAQPAWVIRRESWAPRCHKAPFLSSRCVVIIPIATAITVCLSVFLVRHVRHEPCLSYIVTTNVSVRDPGVVSVLVPRAFFRLSRKEKEEKKCLAFPGGDDGARGRGGCEDACCRVPPSDPQIFARIERLADQFSSSPDENAPRTRTE